MPSLPIPTSQPPVRTRFLDASAMFAAVTSREAERSDPAVWRLQDLVELTEHLIEVALAGDAEEVAVALASIKTSARAVAPLLRQVMAARIAIGMRQAIAAERRGDLVAVTFAALEIYRLAACQLPPVGGGAIKPVLLLNHAGLKLIALSRLVPHDWAAAYDTLGEVLLFSYGIDHTAQPTYLDKALAGTVTSLSEAIGSNDRQRLEQCARRIHVIALRLAGQSDHPHP